MKSLLYLGEDGQPDAIILRHLDERSCSCGWQVDVRAPPLFFWKERGCSLDAIFDTVR